VCEGVRKIAECRALRAGLRCEQPEVIANSHRSGSSISLPMPLDDLGNLARSLDCKHHRSRLSCTRLSHAERSIAEPRIAVIPIPTATDNFGVPRQN
jgi:hypothetical protein